MPFYAVVLLKRDTSKIIYASEFPNPIPKAGVFWSRWKPFAEPLANQVDKLVEVLVCHRLHSLPHSWVPQALGGRVPSPATATLDER